MFHYHHSRFVYINDILQNIHFNANCYRYIVDLVNARSIHGKFD